MICPTIPRIYNFLRQNCLQYLFAHLRSIGTFYAINPRNLGRYVVPNNWDDRVSERSTAYSESEDALTSRRSTHNVISCVPLLTMSQSWETFRSFDSVMTWFLCGCGRAGHFFASAVWRVTFLRVRVEMTRSPAEHPYSSTYASVKVYEYFSRSVAKDGTFR